MNPRKLEGTPLLPQLRNLQPVQFRPVLDAFLAAGQGLGHLFERHALLREGVELLKLVAGPGLAVAFEAFGHGGFSIDPPRSRGGGPR